MYSCQLIVFIYEEKCKISQNDKHHVNHLSNQTPDITTNEITIEVFIHLNCFDRYRNWVILKKIHWTNSRCHKLLS